MTGGARLRQAAGALLLILSLPAPAATLLLDVRLDPQARLLEGDAQFDPPTPDFLLGARFSPEPPAAWRRLGDDGQPLPPVADTDAAAAGAAADTVYRWRRLDGARIARMRYSGRLDPLPAAADARSVLDARAPVADPAGSWLPAASRWFPARDDEPFLYRLRLSLPGTQRGLVPGELLSAVSADGRWQAEFVAELPLEGLDLFAGPYQIEERRLARAEGGEPLLIRSWFTGAVEGLGAGYREAAAGYLDGYAQRFGAYPLSGYSIVSSPLPAGFAVPGITYLGESVLRLPFIRTTSLRHEVLHAWWGNGVRPDYARGNWCEGLVTLIADHDGRDEETPQSALALRIDWLRDLAALGPEADYPLRAFTSRRHGADQIVGYRKGAYVFLMLRERIGAAAFDAALRELWRRWRGRTADWAVLQTLFEQASGQRLGEWLAQWLDRTGLPAPQLALAEASREAGGWRLRLRLTQPGQPWQLTLPVVIDTEDGAQSELTLALARPSDEFVTALAVRPVAVRLDPQARTARRLEAAELPPILRQLQIASGVQVLLGGKPEDWPQTLAGLGRWLDRPANGDGHGPRIVVGPAAQIDAWLATQRLTRPEQVTGGSAQAWAMIDAAGQPLLLLSAADDTDAAPLVEKLAHHGRYGWLTLAADGSVAGRGQWPAPQRAVPVRISGVP